MSAQKSSSKRISLNKVDAFTKNKIIDSLIKNKLSDEKPKIKQSVKKITSRQQIQTQNYYQRAFQIKKRRSLSLKTITTSMSRIKQSLNFDPLAQIPKAISQQKNFIISRQRSSPLLDQQYIQKNADSRFDYKSFQVKFQQTDKLVYPQIVNLQYTSTGRKDSNKEKIQAYIKELQQRTEQRVQKDLWVSNEPYIQSVFDSLNEDKNAINLISQIQTPKMKSSNFVPKYQSNGPLKSNKTKKYQSRHEIVYDFRKYHREDYESLQGWFDKNIKLTKQNVNCQNYKDKFNKVYALYICAFLQITRLTYIQSYQKGIFFEKMLWSFIRLFSRLIQQQHSINYQDFQYFNNENKQMRSMYQDRSSKLQKMMLIAQAESNSTIQIRSKLSKAYLTYSRVNRVLSEELQQKSLQLKQIQSQNSLIKHKLMKMIQILEQKQFIKTTVDQYYTSYYYFYENKAETLIQIPMKNQKKQKFIHSFLTEGEKIKSQVEVNEDSNVAKKIRKVQHQLNKYWVKKQQDLMIKNLIDNELIHYDTKNVETQTQLIESTNKTVQFPEQSQSNSFAQFLTIQLQDQRQNFQKQMQNQNDLYISLKELYEQSYQQITLLTQNNKKLKFQLQKNKITIQKLQKQNTINFRQNYQLNQKLKEYQTVLCTKDSLLQQCTKKIDKFQNQFNQINKKFNLQLQNSRNLVRSNLQQKQKISITEQKLKQTSQKQKQLFQKVQRLESFQKQFTSIDKRLKKLSPTLQKFLEYQKFDNDSIIRKCKQDIQMLLDNYVSKDSGLFLTKTN